MNKKEILDILFSNDFKHFDNKLSAEEEIIINQAIKELEPILNIKDQADNVLLHDTLSNALFEISLKSLEIAYKTVDSVLN